MDALSDRVARAESGDLEAYGRLVGETEAMAYAVALSILRNPAQAEDAVQESYLRAFRRLGDLNEAAAFRGWMRRIVITVAMNMRRSERATLLRLDDVPEVPVLDEEEARWSEAQRQRLAAALLSLDDDERRLCDRRYHGGWSFARLAAARGVSEAAIRKRLQRIRDKLRKEMEMAEQLGIGPGGVPRELPAKIMELLARPRLTDLPENPVAQTLDRLRGAYTDFEEIELPEVLDLTQVRESLAGDAVYVNSSELHRVDETQILRSDLTLPLLQTVRWPGRGLRLRAAGKVYRACQTDATHLEAFHQAEILWMDRPGRVDPWLMASRILRSIDAILPGSSVRIVPTTYPMCSQAWELEIEDDGQWMEVLAWGVYTERIVRHLGADPGRVAAVGAGYGLERLAMLRYGIDDVRKVEAASVA